MKSNLNVFSLALSIMLAYPERTAILEVMPYKTIYLVHFNATQSFIP